MLNLIVSHVGVLNDWAMADVVSAIGGHWYADPAATVDALRAALHPPDGMVMVQEEALKALSMILSAQHDEDVRCSAAEFKALQSGIRVSLQDDHLTDLKPALWPYLDSCYRSLLRPA